MRKKKDSVSIQIKATPVSPKEEIKSSLILKKGDRVILNHNEKCVGNIVKIKEDMFIIQWDSYKKGDIHPYPLEKLTKVK